MSLLKIINQIKTFLAGFSILTLISLFQNCSRSYSIANSQETDLSLDKTSYEVREMTKTFTVKPSGAELDILVVMDNSGSMETEQANMSERMGDFINELGDRQDYQIGIITTDVSTNDERKDGRFIEFQGLQDEYILKSKVHPKNQILDSFKATIKLGIGGDGSEQGMFATWRAIERAFDPKSLDVNKSNREFFRQNASLDVILVSDADETTRPGQPDKIKNGEELVKRIQKVFPEKPFRFHSIIVKPGDNRCQSSNGNEAQGLLYAGLSNLTQGIIGSVCADNYSNQLSEIGKRVISSTRRFQLDCEAIPPSAGKRTFDPTISGPTEFNPNAIEFKGTEVISSEDFPPGEYTVKYFCKGN